LRGAAGERPLDHEQDGGEEDQQGSERGEDLFGRAQEEDGAEGAAEQARQGEGPEASPGLPHPPPVTRGGRPGGRGEGPPAGGVGGGGWTAGGGGGGWGGWGSPPRPPWRSSPPRLRRPQPAPGFVGASKLGLGPRPPHRDVQRLEHLGVVRVFLGQGNEVERR